MKRAAAALFDALSLVVIAGYAKFATAAPPAEFDFLADWGLKARVFFAARGIDWNFLDHAPPHLAHPNYPPLVPLTFDLVAMLRGGWSDELLGIVNVAFAVALLIFVRWLAFAETRSHVIAAFVAFALVPLACVPWIGTAEAPFIALATAALLLIRRGSVTAGAIVLGLAALTKNEGLTLIVAVAVALIASRRIRDLVRLLPAAVLVLPWWLVVATHGFPRDLITGDFIGRVLQHLRDPLPLLTNFLQSGFGKPLFWIALVVGIALVAHVERFVVIAAAVQLAAYLSAYFVMPFDATMIRFSNERLVAHLAPALAYVVLVRLSASGLRRMSRNSSPMPTQIAESATLNAGQ